MRFKNFARRVAMAGVLLGSLSCSDANAPGTGTLSLVLKDAPGEVLAAVVTISEINLQGSGGSLTLSNTEVTTNLLTLSADVIALVQDVVIPAGIYTQLRFVISGAYIEVDNGDGTTSIYASSPDYAGLPPGATVAGSLQMPSFGQSGLKVILPGDALVIPDGGEVLLVLDFDVAQSFGHVAGGSGQWVMHPVVKATRASTTGSALVTLTLGTGVTLQGALLSEFSTTMTGSDAVDRGPVNFTDLDGDGIFEAGFQFLAPGDYTVTITAPVTVPAFTTTPALPGTLTVPSGGTGTAAFVITGADGGGT
jgi:hypothetical protein